MWPFNPPSAQPIIRAEPVLPRPAAGVRFTEAGLSSLPSAPPRTTASSPWTLPKPMPGVVPPASVVAMDEAMGDVYAYAQGLAAEGLVFLGYPMLAEMAQRTEYRIVSETFAKQMTRKWVRLHASGNKDRNDRLNELRAEMERLRIQAHFREALEHDGLFGRGQLLVDTGQGDNPDEMAKPLPLDAAKVGLGSFKGIKAVEPIWTYPAPYNSTNPMRADFYAPDSWFMMSRRVHATRLLGLVSRQVPDILKPAYMFGGLSLSQMVKPYVDRWVKTREDVSDLIESFTLWVLKTDMSAVAQQTGVIGASGASDLIARVEAFTRFQRNRGVFLVDKNAEDFSSVTTPLGTLDSLQAQAQEHVASAAGIPLVILLGITPSGLNASSDGEIRAFYDRVKGMQESTIRQPLRTVLGLMQLSLWGEIDPAIDFDFEPLWEQSELERATIRKTNAEAAVSMIDASILTPDEERARLAREDGGLYDGLDLSVDIEAPAQEGDDDLLAETLATAEA